MAKKQTGRPGKDAAKKKASYLQVRVTTTQGAIFDAAADLAGLDKSAWVRNRLLAIARSELRAAGKEVPSMSGKTG